MKNKLRLCTRPITITHENEEFLFTCYFDGISTVLYTKGSVRDAIAGTKFEGIIVDESTPIVWEEHNYSYLNLLKEKRFSIL
ncbi:hypothetical protein JR050_10340 [Bacillus sp. RD4P76]|uniref:DUF2442 domain-containing protein n=1 Tax=Bacillus suaedaesalsae TaxID=2810349 RepID=A0ABS2DKK3_9BACI|nr:hypothetical protein [Bacillus suaedaesalsae]